VKNGSAFGSTVPCLFDVWGNAVLNNTFKGNGSFGNTTNGDLADLSQQPSEQPGAPGDCFHGNKKSNGSQATTWPVTLQTTQGTCGQSNYPDSGSFSVLAAQVVCNTQALGPCPSGADDNYPRQTKVVMHAMPRQPTMPHPCSNVPADPWCR
jgi:hypothetical protein